MMSSSHWTKAHPGRKLNKKHTLHFHGKVASNALNYALKSEPRENVLPSTLKWLQGSCLGNAGDQDLENVKTIQILKLKQQNQPE